MVIPVIDLELLLELTAYPKGYSVRLQLLRLAVTTGVLAITIIGTFILLSFYIRSTQCSCSNNDALRRIDPEPLVAESEPDIRLHIGEDLKSHKNKSHLDCLVEKKEQVLDAIPSQGDGMKVQVKGQQTIISCITGKGKRARRSAPCECRCACR
ncbi:uncharacterized protein LOC118181044 [Stegodyphus dumicola]|uniref:uncharacterized protein LOC118181044 n=1 Tax=Stegodyphus dumicola TaxID=202533 RepID=UPI0015B25B68|nr:uncharacterized protein LOC118181044 [Stegodyphus dumicola]